jgi:hypothetical protein
MTCVCTALIRLLFASLLSPSAASAASNNDIGQCRRTDHTGYYHLDTTVACTQWVQAASDTGNMDRLQGGEFIQSL